MIFKRTLTIFLDLYLINCSHLHASVIQAFPIGWHG
jgi:hypothetical protein